METLYIVILLTIYREIVPEQVSGVHADRPDGAASNATRELEDLMSNLSDFKVDNSSI